MSALEYISLEEAAKKWRTKPWYISKACDAGQVPGAAKLGDTWIIPSDLERPEMHIQRDEQKATTAVEHGSAYKDAIYRMTMDSFPNFNVTTTTIGKTTYTVYSAFSPDATETLEEKLLRLVMRDVGVPRDEESKRKLAEFKAQAQAKLPSSDQLRDYYRTKFIEIGFSDEELAVLMEKIEEHIQTRNRKLGIE